MAKTTKPTTTKVKVKAKKAEPEAPRENRYSRSAKIMSNPTIDAQALSKQAEMSLSTARHCLEAWHGITGVLIQRSALTPTWAKQLSPRPTKAEPVAAAK